MQTVGTLALALACALAGCGGPLDRAVEDRVTITQGVYGQAIVGCDTAGCEDRYDEGVDVGAFATAPAYGTEGSPIGLTVADVRGFFQLALAAGPAAICPLQRQPDGRLLVLQACTSLSIDGGLVRRDFTSGPGGGFWR